MTRACHVQRLAVLLLANWLWACLGRRQEGGMQLEHLQLPLQEAPHLRSAPPPWLLLDLLQLLGGRAVPNWACG